MKKYRICFYLFLLTSILCFGIGFAASRSQNHTMEEIALTETEMVVSEAANQQMVQHQTEEESYYLVSENGFLLVFSKDRESVCLYTHIPLTDLPQEEQDRLRSGIWFSSMQELFQYLESCTS